MPIKLITQDAPATHFSRPENILQFAVTQQVNFTNHHLLQPSLSHLNQSIKAIIVSAA